MTIVGVRTVAEKLTTEVCKSLHTSVADPNPSPPRQLRTPDPDASMSLEVAPAAP
jgi:hypothetical protein